MGYAHDTHMHSWTPPTLIHCVTGTWADAAGAVANTITTKKTAADNTAVVTIPILVPMNDGPDKGACLTSIDIYWQCRTAANDAVTPVIYPITLPADTAVMVVGTALAFSYDTGNDTANERLTLDEHTMTLTLTTPLWIEDDMIVQVQLTVDAALTSVDDIIGARANYVFRV
jgi:hypothetical protein